MLLIAHKKMNTKFNQKFGVLIQYPLWKEERVWLDWSRQDTCWTGKGQSSNSSGFSLAFALLDTMETPHWHLLQKRTWPCPPAMWVGLYHPHTPPQSRMGSGAEVSLSNQEVQRSQRWRKHFGHLQCWNDRELDYTPLMGGHTLSIVVTHLRSHI